MFIPKSFIELFTVNKEAVDTLKLDAAVLRAQNALLERELVSVKISSDWMRMRVNQLEIERAALMDKAYPGLHIPTPEIARIANKVRDAFDLTSIFDDQGEEDVPTKPLS